jgi:SagB-type dehydrogenase family enzyme
MPFDKDAVDRVADALLRARQAYERERVEHFRAAFGLDEGCQWPATRVYHEYSAFGPAWFSPLTEEEATRLTLDRNYRRYEGAPRVLLPPPTLPDVKLRDAIAGRKSCRAFADQPVSLEALSGLLQMACGVIDQADIVPRRAAPSGGGLYPVEPYVVARAVTGLEPGIYHYLPLEHQLEQLRTLPDPTILMQVIPALALDQEVPPLVLCLSGIFARTQAKYRERGYRFILLEAGHIGQNVSLAAPAFGLGAVCIGGFKDEDLNALMGFDPSEEASIYTILVGHPQ